MISRKVHPTITQIYVDLWMRGHITLAELAELLK